VELLEQGESPAVIARILGVNRTSLHRWRRLARTARGLASKPPSGPKRRRSDAPLQHLDQLLRQGASAHGFPHELWTANRVAPLIPARCGIRYHPEHVRKLLKHRLHYRRPKPQRRARERNDKEVERWKADEFPRIGREADRRNAHVAFLDESGFMLQPRVRRTLAPRGQRVIVRCSEAHDRISAISCVTLSPKARRRGLSFGFLLNPNFHGEEVVEFLQALLRQLPGPWTVVGDGNHIHRKSTVVRARWARHPDLVVENFPRDDPQSNPDEGVWSWAKYGKLGNCCPNDVEGLRDAVFDALNDLKHRPNVLASFVKDAGLQLCL
jgi:transposase